MTEQIVPDAVVERSKLFHIGGYLAAQSSATLGRMLTALEVARTATARDRRRFKGDDGLADAADALAGLSHAIADELRQRDRRAQVAR